MANFPVILRMMANTCISWRAEWREQWRESLVPATEQKHTANLKPTWAQIGVHLNWNNPFDKIYYTPTHHVIQIYPVRSFLDHSFNVICCRFLLIFAQDGCNWLTILSFSLCISCPGSLSFQLMTSRCLLTGFVCSGFSGVKGTFYLGVMAYIQHTENHQHLLRFLGAKMFNICK